jgi:hypothetical protein
MPIYYKIVVFFGFLNRARPDNFRGRLRETACPMLSIGIVLRFGYIGLNVTRAF